MKTIKKIIWLLLILTSVAYSQQKSKIELLKITDKIFMLKGPGGNIGLFIGTDKVYMIDGKFANLTSDIVYEVKKITDKPIQYLINTHWHGDHTGSNENLQKQGSVVIAHENVRKRMGVDNIVRGEKRPASPKEALPVITFTKDMMLYENDEEILLSHVHNAHTDGDIHVYFLSSNVLHMGDTYFQGKFPYIDIDSGGTIDGYIAAVEKALMLIDDKTIIIPGHMELSNKDELTVYKNMLIDLRNKVQKEIELGKSLDEVTNDESITKDYEVDYDWNFISAEKIRTTIYKSLKNK